jgi:hypothetical protein
VLQRDREREQVVLGGDEGEQQARIATGRQRTGDGVLGGDHGIAIAGVADPHPTCGCRQGQW